MDFKYLSKTQNKKEVWANKIPVISIFETAIDIPLALQKRVLYSELISIEYQEGYLFHKLIIEFNSADAVELKSFFWYIRHSSNGENNKLVWYLPLEKDFVIGLEWAVLKIQNRIGLDKAA
jgi:hypothetical protein